MRKQFPTSRDNRLIYYPMAIPQGASLELTLTDESGVQWGEEANPQTVALEATSQLTTADAKQGDTSLVVAATTGYVRDRFYMVVLVDGFYFPVRVLGVDATTKALRLDSGVPVAVPTGATVRGLAAIREITADETATEVRNIQAQWVFVLDGETTSDLVMFDVVPHPFWFSITPADCEGLDHQFSDYAGRLKRWTRLVGAAHGDIDEMIRGSGLQPDRFLDRDILKTAVVCSLLEQYHMQSTPARSAYFREKKVDSVRRATDSFSRYREALSGVSGSDQSTGIVRARPPGTNFAKVG